MSDLDETDLKIIEILAKNSRISLREIAKKTGVSVDTIARRYANLEKERIIQPVITVNLCKLGYEAIVFFAIQVSSQGELRQITKQVAQVPDVAAVMETTGECDL